MYYLTPIFIVEGFDTKVKGKAYYLTIYPIVAEKTLLIAFYFLFKDFKVFTFSLCSQAGVVILLLTTTCALPI